MTVIGETVVAVPFLSRAFACFCMILHQNPASRSADILLLLPSLFGRRKAGVQANYHCVPAAAAALQSSAGGDPWDEDREQRGRASARVQVHTFRTITMSLPPLSLLLIIILHPHPSFAADQTDLLLISIV